jgi:hypothetical protein
VFYGCYVIYFHVVNKFNFCRILNGYMLMIKLYSITFIYPLFHLVFYKALWGQKPYTWYQSLASELKLGLDHPLNCAFYSQTPNLQPRNQQMFRILLMRKGCKDIPSMSLFHRVAHTVCFSFHVLFEILYLAMLLTVVK